MKTLIAILLTFYLPIACFGQRNENSYGFYKAEADRIVMRFLGSEVVHRYMALDSGKSLYRTTVDGHPRATTFSEVPQFTPAEFVFYYTFRHPRFQGENFRISFTLDSAAQFRVDDKTYGLIHMRDFNEAKVVSRKEALAICRAESHRLKKSSLTLAWIDNTVDYDRFKRTHDLADLWSGRMMWQAEARVKFRGKVYDGTLAVDALTGQVMRVFPELPWD